jgi:hypothetical protein
LQPGVVRLEDLQQLRQAVVAVARVAYSAW